MEEKIKINWAQKFSSRKFQAAIVGFITALLVAFNFGEDAIVKVSGVITSAGVLIAYIFAEASVDAARESAPQYIEVVETDETLENHGVTLNSQSGGIDG